MPQYHIDNVKFPDSSYNVIVPNIFFTLERIIREWKPWAIQGDKKKIVIECEYTTITVTPAFEGD